METKQHPLCRMRHGWCRDCESSEYKKECMEAKHTPGLWKMVEDLDGDCSVETEEYCVALVYSKADAELIAQAPDLLAKVQQLELENEELKRALYGPTPKP